MRELTRIARNTHLIPGSTTVGVAVNGQNCVLIDTGLDKSVAKRILRTLEASGLSVRAIINTHAHADHCGANAFIQAETGCMAYASRFEGGILVNPDIETLYLNGAAPPKALVSRMVLAEATKYFSPLDEGKHLIEGMEFELVALPGHSAGQLGVITPDNVLFFGDAMVPANVFDKYILPFVTDVESALESIDKIARMKVVDHVGAHTGVVEDIESLCNFNRRGIELGCDIVLELIDGAILREAVLQKLLSKYNLQFSPVQWTLMLTCVSACLYSLFKQGRIEIIIERGAMLWKKK